MLVMQAASVHAYRLPYRCRGLVCEREYELPASVSTLLRVPSQALVLLEGTISEEQGAHGGLDIMTCLHSDNGKCLTFTVRQLTATNQD